MGLKHMAVVVVAAAVMIGLTMTVMIQNHPSFVALVVLDASFVSLHDFVDVVAFVIYCSL
jgi:hypothetical protein